MPNELIPRHSALAEYLPPQWSDHYIAWLASQNSQRTRSVYHAAWQHFLGVAQVHADDITEQHVIRFKEYMRTATEKRKPYSANYINLHLSAIRSFYAWLIDRGVQTKNPAASVKNLPIKKYGKARFFKDAAEVQRFLDTIESAKEKAWHDWQQALASGKTGDWQRYQAEAIWRDYALFAVALTTALRKEALITLLIEDVETTLDRDGGVQSMTIRFKNKGSVEKEDSIELPAPAAAAVLEYIHRFRQDFTPSEPLFTSVKTRTPLDTSDPNKRFVKWLKRAGLNTNINFHGTRHTAIRLAAKHFKMHELKDFSRHADMATLLIYLDALESEKPSKVAATISDDIFGN